jgi:hypothetical protein
MEFILCVSIVINFSGHIFGKAPTMEFKQTIISYNIKRVQFIIYLWNVIFGT